MPVTKNVIPLEALFTSRHAAELRADATINAADLIADVDVIFVVDVMSGDDQLVFGRALLRDVVDSGKGRRLKVLRVAVDVETDELEKLLAAVRVVKGFHDYPRSVDKE